MSKDFVSDNPKLLSEWHPTKNGDLAPNDVTSGSKRKIWWQCEKGHEWNTTVNSRTSSKSKGNGCPYCAGQRVHIDNCLQTLNPKLSMQWHPSKNGNLTPNDVTVGSNKKVWWSCEKGHEWEATVNNRTNAGSGCPFCTGKRACVDNSLQTLYPELSKQWHPTQNGDLTPDNVTISSSKKVWWLCDVGHEWEALISNRTVKDSGCPFCAGKRACIDNNLQVLNPELAKQWHPTKNGNLTPNDVTEYSNKKVWWICDKGHEWQANIGSRAYGSGCPDCNQESQTSFPEQAIFFYIKTIFDDALNRYKYNNKWEIDIFIPSLCFGVEYDGFFFHKGKDILEQDKENYLKDDKIHLLRIKETENKIGHLFQDKTIIYCGRKVSGIQLNAAIAACIDYISKNITYENYDIDIDVERDRIKIYELFIKSEKELSLFSLFPELTKEWHPTKNGKLSPEYVKTGSEKKVWWLCKKEHEWEMSVKNRVNGQECPFCAGKRACFDNCLQTLNPELAKQWHPTKNGDLTPNDVTMGSDKKIWWMCEKGHRWEARIPDRAKGDCPYCSGNRVCFDNCLQTLNPELSKQWHPTKNDDLTPSDVTTGSKKKVWWMCEKEHEWEATVNGRSSGNGCPFCSGNKVCIENCLQTLNPQLARQWHPTKNGDLTPDNVSTGSNKKVWWRCEKGHDWEAAVSSRVSGRGCPYCSGQRVCIDNCLQTVNFELAKQWHPSKNDDLTPADVSAGSTKKIWWVCKKGHEWEAPVNNRQSGSGCPFCSGNKVCIENCLQTLNPQLAKQWHPTRNEKLSPSDVTVGSKKKIWWICEKGHEWEASVNNRANGTGCPYCAGRRV